MKRNYFISLLAASFVLPASAHKPEAPLSEAQTKVQLAILLDTSSSMSGLIEQTKTQLWTVVNTFLDAEQDGNVPFVEVALYEYGNSRLDQNADWIRQIQPFTRDLDQVSEDLFGLTTNGGDEYCGAVITRAIADLKWDASPKVYKAIFIAGNEAFTQGPIDPRSACEEAVGKGVIVNTIHCGDHQSGIAGSWNTGQLIAGGSYLTINHNAAVAHIKAPQDEKIVKLNAELNRTYIPYGKKGVSKKAQQVNQDLNANGKKESGAEVQRAISKSSSNYWNASWDLCDASRVKGFDWSQVKDADLPKEMQKLDLEGRKKYVLKNQTTRAGLKKEIQMWNVKRSKFVAKERKKQAVESTLDVVVTKTVREQALKNGFQFKKK